ncbi:hypothetical protein [Sulfitobacter sp. R18_1]|uniref:hypothetical protein n=1 Tax=Sulfitobacter sp. R18_1 TaxID=2821104 RepID=UPI001ADB7CD8|nr:hypothetical protein [Sulfitobacter sp. R18_1]MBO9428216.1 hypothetical protein [Sulfitobacter sp. R18_1]
MRRLSEHYGMPRLKWKVSPYVYSLMEIATTPLGPIRVRQERDGSGATAILPPSLAQGAPSSMSEERQLINRPTMNDAKLAAQERYFLHVRSILGGSWQNIKWKRKENCVGEHYVGYSHIGRWQIGFAYDDGPRMGYVSSPTMIDDPRSPRPYYPHASLDDLKEIVSDLNVEITKKAVVGIEDAYRSMINKQGILKKMEWESLGKRSRLNAAVGEIVITPISDDDPEPTYVCDLPWMVAEHAEDMAVMPDKDMAAIKVRVQGILQVLAARFTE